MAKTKKGIKPPKGPINAARKGAVVKTAKGGHGGPHGMKAPKAPKMPKMKPKKK